MSLVDNIKKALRWRIAKVRTSFVLRLAHLNRRRLKRTVFVGITGSAGKTTTKDLAVAVLGRIGSVISNDASLNYLTEVADVVRRAASRNRFAVIEVSTNKPGDIAPKADLIKPQIAVLTVVQREHVKNFDSIELIAEEKGELIFALPPDGVAVLNIDDPLVRSIGERTQVRRIWFGSSPEADLRLLDATSSWPETLILEIEYQGRRLKCVTTLHGKHLAVPVLAAIGLGVAAGGSIEDCIEAVASARTTPGRMQVVDAEDGVTFVRDDYKAPYWSFSAALEYLRDAKSRRKVAVIGTISDYSLSASKLYPKVARMAMEVADLVVFVGPHALRALKARQADEAGSLVGFPEAEDANRFLQQNLREGDLVLLKGSNHADHLIRLMLARRRDVSCWVRNCGLNRFCDVCPQLDRVPSMSLAPKVPLTGGLRASSEGVENDMRLQFNADANPVWLILGMGNWGEKYDETPHNVGFRFLDYFAETVDAKWLPASEGVVCGMKVGGKEVLLFKPAAPTNACGPVIEEFFRRYGLTSERVLVIHDDADLPLGRVRIKRSGSDGGHKGLRSVFAALKPDGVMPRIRIGVRKEGVGGAVAARSTVLERFGEEDRDVLNAAFAGVAEEVVSLVAADGATAVRSSAEVI